MPFPFLPLALGALGVGGQMMTNRANRGMAREQMQFQERMSSTAAQRSALDYQKAGLNPALAYDRPASSPSGASTMMGDAVGAGIATAQDARRAQKEIDLATEQTRTAKGVADVESDPSVVRARRDAARHEANARGEIAQIDAGSKFRDARFQEELQPVQLRTAILDEMIKRYSVRGITSSFLSNIRGVMNSNAGTLDRFKRSDALDNYPALPSVTGTPSPFTMRRFHP